MRLWRFWGLAAVFLVSVWAKTAQAEHFGLFVPITVAENPHYDHHLLLVYISEQADGCDAFSSPEESDGTVELPSRSADLVFFYRPRGTKLAGKYHCSSLGEKNSPRWFHMYQITMPEDEDGEAVPAQLPPRSACMAQLGKVQRDESGQNFVDVEVNSPYLNRVVRATYCEALANIW